MQESCNDLQSQNTILKNALRRLISTALRHGDTVIDRRPGIVAGKKEMGLRSS
jgi:hypothetical protein